MVHVLCRTCWQCWLSPGGRPAQQIGLAFSLLEALSAFPQSLNHINDTWKAFLQSELVFALDFQSEFPPFSFQTKGCSLVG